MSDFLEVAKINIDIKLVGLNKKTLKIQKKNTIFFMYFKSLFIKIIS